MSLRGWYNQDLLDISVFITITVYASTGGLLVLIVSSSHWHGLLDISVFITITVYASTGGKHVTERMIQSRLIVHQ
jgi:hypothetical protein